MATYKGIQGYSVQKLSEDPGTLGNVVGQLWYNSSIGKFKVAVQGAGAWSSGGNTNTPRFSTGQGGTPTAALIFGGRIPADTAFTEAYDGTSWTEVNDLNTARTQICGFGTVQNACMAASGGPVTTICESWNGTSWTEVNDVNTGAISRGGAGTQAAGLSVSGLSTLDTESWDGTCWTEVNNFNTIRKAMGQAGTQTAAIMVGGNTLPGAVLALVEEWNGTSWTETTDLAVTRGNMSGAGTQTDAMIFGGHEPALTGKTEKWNGSAWTEVGDMATARTDLPGNGASATTTVALASTGYITPSSPGWNLTEEWTGAPVSAKVVTVS